jgi:membrane associated rhomboid family serine protease
MAFRGSGRRLADGATMHRSAAEVARSSLGTAISGVAAAVALATCPSHDSFEAFLARAAAHPSGFLGSLSAIAERVRIAVGAESRSWLILRTGTHRGKRFLGAFGTWTWIPSFPQASLLPASLSGAAFCRADAGTPHELFALVCIGVFVLAQVAPGFVARHCICSYGAVRGGRLWVLLTSNVAHFSPTHLFNNLLQVLHFGPIVHSALGCERFAVLLLCCALASSSASVLWHGWMHGRSSDGSIGGSGVASAIVAANAALFPRVVVSMYGIELTAGAHLLLYLLLDALSIGRVADVAAHAGGAACAWALVQHWRPWWL